MRLKGEKGFTLVEVIVVAAIIAVLAGILVPMIFSQIDEAKISRAKGDLRSLSSAIFTFRKDVGQWPAGGGATVMYGQGVSAQATISGLGYDITGVSNFDDHLMDSATAQNTYGDMWKGPYFGSVSADPWGNPYFVNAKGFADPKQPVLVLSAGPNGTFETAPNDTAAKGDDIGIRIK